MTFDFISKITNHVVTERNASFHRSIIRILVIINERLKVSLFGRVLGLECDHGAVVLSQRHSKRVSIKKTRCIIYEEKVKNSYRDAVLKRGDLDTRRMMSSNYLFCEVSRCFSIH